MVDTPAPTGETLTEIAERHHRTYETLRTEWSRHPAWPAPIGKRGRSHVYDPAAVDRVIAEHLARPTPTLTPDRLYTAREIEAATGISTGTIRADRSTGRWPAPDGKTGRAHSWYGRTITPILQNRRAYRRATED
ncbi:hypothetical protein [Streptomyces sp. CAU 1734]|uniref:helix-turn-helix transcriptional regulator n=1 Tax=Streptomyces sp. CAU 1734 TaxID=3140360 RepID=UPI0032613B38